IFQSGCPSTWPVEATPAALFSTSPFPHALTRRHASNIIFPFIVHSPSSDGDRYTARCSDFKQKKGPNMGPEQD
ncbi:hypothetical protein, partial [Pseudomonas aeruginosa]|uniref:hypothetical protein n=1 Tax=Pseudomonas aeruginosa TaxID=287 RepID=UPI002AB3A4F8